MPIGYGGMFPILQGLLFSDTQGVTPQDAETSDR